MKSNLDIINDIVKHEERRFGKDVHGTHYNQDHSYQTFSPITFIEHIGCSFELGNVVKYVYRFNRKNKAEDLLKALTYVHYAAANSTIGPSQTQLNEVRDSKSIYSKNAQDYIRASLTDIFKQHDPEIGNLIVNIFYNIVDASTTNMHDRYLELLAVIATDIQKILEKQYRYTIIDGMDEMHLRGWVQAYMYIGAIYINQAFDTPSDYDVFYKIVEEHIDRAGLKTKNDYIRYSDEMVYKLDNWVGHNIRVDIDRSIRKLSNKIDSQNFYNEYKLLEQDIVNKIRRGVIYFRRGID